MIKRMICLGVSICLILTIFPYFNVSADESGFTLYTLNYDLSTDNGTTWREQSRVLNYESDIVLYSNYKIRLKSLNVQRYNNVSGYIYFLINSDLFSSRPSYNISNGSALFYTFNNGVWGCLSPEIQSYTFTFENTINGLSSGSLTLHSQIYDSFNYSNFLNQLIFQLDNIYNQLDHWEYGWQNSFMPHFDNIWSIMTQTNYSYQGFAGNGAGLNSLTTKNPFQAINNHLSAIVRYFNKIQRNDYSYDSVSYDLDGIGTTTVVNNVPWFDAMLGQLKGSSAIEQHHMQMENEALEAGAGDIYNQALSDVGGSYTAIGNLFGLNSLRSLFDFSEWSTNGLSIISGWFTQTNSDQINGSNTGRVPDETVADFVSQNLELDWFGDHDE